MPIYVCVRVRAALRAPRSFDDAAAPGCPRAAGRPARSRPGSAWAARPTRGWRRSGCRRPGAGHLQGRPGVRHRACSGSGSGGRSSRPSTRSSPGTSGRSSRTRAATTTRRCGRAIRCPAAGHGHGPRTRARARAPARPRRTNPSRAPSCAPTAHVRASERRPRRSRPRTTGPRDRPPHSAAPHCRSPRPTCAPTWRAPSRGAGPASTPPSARCGRPTPRTTGGCRSAWSRRGTSTDVEAAVAVCRAHDVPVLPRRRRHLDRGPGGQHRGRARLHGTSNRILEIDPEARTARVQPGVVCDALRDAARAARADLRPRPVHAQPLHARRDDRQQRVRVALGGVGQDRRQRARAGRAHLPRASGCAGRRAAAGAHPGRAARAGGAAARTTSAPASPT